LLLLLVPLPNTGHRSRPVVFFPEAEATHMALPPILLPLLILLGSRAAWSAAQQQNAAATLHERDTAVLRDVRAGLRDMPGSRFFDSWDDARSPGTAGEGGSICFCGIDWLWSGSHRFGVEERSPL
jgi:hypothetical protein